MSREKGFVEQLKNDVNLYNGTIMNLPIIEISDVNRVLIENHLGVREYDLNKICVNMKYGLAAICGEQLKLRQMTKDQLVITGKIEGISLMRRRRK